jgi:hypothetical protein
VSRKRHKIYVNGKVHIRRKQCSTCIFGPRSPVDQERVDDMVAKATRNDDGCIPCHHHLHQGKPIEPVCKGFFDRYATMPLRMAVALEVVEWVT